jgi:HD-like signal output (HDOD) protein
VFVLDEAIHAAERLEALPPTLSRLALLVADSDTEVRAIVEAIAFDPALASVLLRFANSAASAANTPIVTVRAAVIRVGRASILSLALGTAVRGWMSEAMPEYGLAESALWRSAVLSAIAAEVISARAKIQPPQEVGVAALLADIGKLVMHRVLDDEVLDWLRQAEVAGLTRREAESEVLGVHHGELGGLIARHWGLPPSIVTGIQYHHTPSESTELISYATYLSCMVSGILMDDPEVNRRVDLDRSLMVLGLASSDIDKLCAITLDRFEQVKTTFGAT